MSVYGPWSWKGVSEWGVGVGGMRARQSGKRNVTRAWGVGGGGGMRRGTQREREFLNDVVIMTITRKLSVFARGGS